VVLYPESKEVATKLATGAIEHIAPLDIAPNPQNIAIWYSYLSGRDPEIVRQIDNMIETDVPFNALRCADLYTAVLKSAGANIDGKHEAVVDAIGVELEMAIAAIVQVLNSAGTEGERYAATLDNAGGELKSVGTSDQLQGIVSKLIEQTQRMVAQNRIANEQLNQSNDEVSKLKARMAEVRQDSLRDPLSDLANRRGLAERMVAAIGESESEHNPLSLLMMDIDHFKSFNDNHGHQLGDQVIRLVANCASANIKGRDTAARYGGEEFAILLPNTNLPGAKKLAEQIRKVVASQKIVRKSTREQLGTVTISIGVSQYRIGETDENFIARADAALYAAKNAGRNCVKVESSENSKVVIE